MNSFVLDSSFDANKRSLVIRLKKDFTFDVNSDFRKAYEDHIGAKEVIIDFKDSAYIDSSGFGMLLVMRDAMGEGCLLKLRNMNDYIRRLVEITDFGKFFIIE